MLEGTLQDFPLPDILQLIGSQRKTGTLIITSADNVATMYFREGRVAYAKLENHPERIGDILIRLKRITGEQLGRALQHGKENGGMRVGRALVALAFARDEDLRDALRTQIEDAAYNIFRWKTGRFKFDPTLAVEDQEAQVDLSVDSVIMESVRRLDENERDAGPGSGDRIFEIVAGGSERAAKLDLSIDDYSVLANLDGQRSVRDIADRLNMAEAELVKSLAHLSDANVVAEVGGTVSVAAPAPAAVRAAAPAAPKEDAFDGIPDLVGPDSPAADAALPIPPAVPPKEPARKISFL